MSFFKSIWKLNTKHKKLSEECALQISKENIETETIEDVDLMTFKLKYLGSTIVEKVQHENVNTEAVKTIIRNFKSSKRQKIRKVTLTISLKGVCVSDKEGNDMFKVSIYRISKCATNFNQKQIFSFISTDENDTTQCHAFLCTNRRTAETVALSVANAFSRAFEAWRIIAMLDNNFQTPTEKISNHASEDIMDQLIDLGDASENEESAFQNQWVSFEQENY